MHTLPENRIEERKHFFHFILQSQHKTLTAKEKIIQGKKKNQTTDGYHSGTVTKISNKNLAN